MGAFEGQWSDAHAMQWHQTLRDYVYPLIGEVALGRIGVDHVVQVMEPLWQDKHTTAVKLRTRMRLILDWAEAMGVRSGDNPTRSKAVDIRLGNNVSHAVKHREAIPYRQMPVFWQALASEESVRGDATRFMILTAVRASEAIGARWEEIDMAERVWTIPAGRMKWTAVTGCLCRPRRWRCWRSAARIRRKRRGPHLPRRQGHADASLGAQGAHPATARHQRDGAWDAKHLRGMGR